MENSKDDIKPNLCVIIPAFNAEKTIGWVINRIPEDAWQMIERIFVINDGSTDDTAQVVEDLKPTYPNIELKSLETNQGYGYAVRKGLELSCQTGSDYVVCLHADGQYPPEKLADFVIYMDQNGVDILQGSRHKNANACQGGMPLYKYIAGKLLTKLENVVFDIRMTDYHSGFLFYSKRALNSIPFDELSQYFDFDLEVIACARSRELKIDEVGIPTHYGDEESYLNPAIYGFKILYVLIRYLLGSYRPTS